MCQLPFQILFLHEITLISHCSIGRYTFYLHFIDFKTEAQRGQDYPASKCWGEQAQMTSDPQCTRSVTLTDCLHQNSARTPSILCWVCYSEGDFSFKWTLQHQPSCTKMFLETFYSFPPDVSLNKNACQQLAHEGGHYQFSISLKKYFGLSFEKSLFQDQRVL